MNESLYNLKTLRSHGMAENVKITCHIDSVYNLLIIKGKVRSLLQTLTEYTACPLLLTTFLKYLSKHLDKS
jgi:hypothetical protein